MLPPSSPKHLGRHDHGRRHDQQLLLLLGLRRPRPIMRKSPRLGRVINTDILSVRHTTMRAAVYLPIEH